MRVHGWSLVVLLALVLAAPAAAHVERPAYWPDPAPDTSVKPAAGGGVPAVRSLSSALVKSRPGATHIVCQANSIALLRTSIATARKKGYDIRPSDHRKLTAKQARKLLRINRRLFKRCRYREIQPAVNASRNNDRVVILPGLYTEPTSRSKPTHDKSCDQYRTDGDRPGLKGSALSYAYQYPCPNDQNLIAVIGRKPGATPPPMPPRENRHGRTGTASRTWGRASAAPSRSRARASGPTTSSSTRAT